MNNTDCSTDYQALRAAAQLDARTNPAVRMVTAIDLREGDLIAAADGSLHLVERVTYGPAEVWDEKLGDFTTKDMWRVHTDTRPGGSTVGSDAEFRVAR